MQIESQNETNFNEKDLDLLAEIIAHFILENVLKDGKSNQAEKSTFNKPR